MVAIHERCLDPALPVLIVGSVILCFTKIDTCQNMPFRSFIWKMRKKAQHCFDTVLALKYTLAAKIICTVLVPILVYFNDHNLVS